MSSNDAGAATPVEANSSRGADGGVADFLCRLGASSLALKGDEELVARLAELERASRQIEAMLVSISGEIDDRCSTVEGDSLAHKLGCRNTVDLIQRVSQRSSAIISRRLRLARGLRAGIGFSGGEIPARFPFVAAALSAGDLPEETAELVCKSLAQLPSWVEPAQISEAERCIVNQAAGYAESHRLEASEGLHEADRKLRRFHKTATQCARFAQYGAPRSTKTDPNPTKCQYRVTATFVLGSSDMGSCPYAVSCCPK